MPRYSRLKSPTNTYHVILRGINKQDIFLELPDYQKFLNELKKTKEKYEYKIYAYVLMTNHIHILIHTPKGNISKVVQSLAVRYSMYFNKKYDRCGHLFQNRFLSKNIDDTAYLLNLQRYIHQNPEKEEIDTMENYCWSSYQEYKNKSVITDTEFILSIFNDNEAKAIELFENFNKIKTEFSILEYEIKNDYTDEEAIKIIKNELEENNLMSIQNNSIKDRKEKIGRVLKIEGIGIAQISRILGINKRTIQRISKDMK